MVIMDYMLIAAAVLLLSSNHTLTFPVYPAQCVQGANTSTKADKQNGVQMVATLPHCCAWVCEDRSWLIKIHLVPTSMAILSCIIWSHAMRDCADAACQSMVRRPHDAPPGALVTVSWLRTPLVGSQAIYHASCLCPAASPG